MAVPAVRTLEQVCLSLLEEALSPHGWTRHPRSGNNFVGRSSGGIGRQFSCNAADSRSVGLFFLPAMGLTHPETTRLERRFMGRPEKGGVLPAVYGRGLADLLPDGFDLARWQIFREGQEGSVAAALAEDILLYGTQFFESVNDLDSLIAKFYERNRSQGEEGRLAILCASSGRRDEARAALERYVEAANGPRPLFSRPTSRRFVREFIEFYKADMDYFSGISVS